MPLTIKLASMGEGVLARKLTIRHGRGSFETPAYTVNPLDVDGDLVSWDDIQGVVEYSIRLRLDALEKISANKDYQRQYEYQQHSMLRRIPEDHLVVAVPLIEGKKGVSVGRREARIHASHVAELVAIPRVDIVCVPVFHKLGEDYIESFIEEFLSEATTLNAYIAPSMPEVSRNTRTRLAIKYYNWQDRSNLILPNLVCVDYNGSNPISKFSFHNYIVKYIKVLEGHLGGPVAVLGVNVKYGKAAGKQEEIAARDLTSYYALLDLQGRNHKRQYLPAEVAERTRKESPLTRYKLLNRMRYTYISLGKALKEQGLLTREVERIAEIISEGQSTSALERSVRLHNVRGFLAETRFLRRVLTDPSEPLEYLRRKEAVKLDEKIMRNIKKFTSTYQTSRLY